MGSALQLVLAHVDGKLDGHAGCELIIPLAQWACSTNVPFHVCMHACVGESVGRYSYSEDIQSIGIQRRTVFAQVNPLVGCHYVVLAARVPHLQSSRLSLCWLMHILSIFIFM